MQKGIPNIITVTKSTKGFDLENMINPMFFNDGNSNANVFGSTLPPGGQLSLDLPFVIGRKSIEISFTDTENQVSPRIDKINVYFGTLLKKPC